MLTVREGFYDEMLEANGSARPTDPSATARSRSTSSRGSSPRPSGRGSSAAWHSASALNLFIDDVYVSGYLWAPPSGDEGADSGAELTASVKMQRTDPAPARA